MKIAFILPDSGSSGGVRATVIMANGLIERGHQVRLLVHKAATFSRDTLRKQWLKIRYRATWGWLGLYKGRVNTFRDLAKCSFENDELAVAVGLWSCQEITRVKNSTVKKVHYIHGAPQWDSDLLKAAWSENVPKLAVSTHLEAKVSEICGQKVVAVIPNGLNTTEYYPSVPESQRDGIGTMFGTTYYKDPETILSVLQRLRQNGDQLPQRIFGACRRPKEIPPKTYIRLPSIEKAREIYSRSVVWFSASRSEGFSCPILEAMACGCAVVATDCGGPSDIINNGENGFLVEVGDVEQMVDRIELLLADAKLRCRIVEKAKETVNKFRWEGSIERLEQALDRIHTLYA
ncbi:MAG: glycosyltransferase family 4 protein [Planctomycetota bacterium]|jgi:glycosyltransferase involved in cell wall biosynthesis